MMHLIYKFHFDNSLIISIKSNFDVKWIEGENWGESLENDKIILSKNKKQIKYKISDKIVNYQDDRLYSHSMVRKNYACFSGNIGLLFPKFDDNVDLKITFMTNFPLVVSGIGEIEKEFSYISTLEILKNQLFILTCEFIRGDNLTITYFNKSIFFIKIQEIYLIVQKFLSRCYKFFKIRENLHFVVNYVDFVPTGETTGYGGNSNYAGFNYLVTIEKTTSKIIKNIKIILLHEIYHHFNKSNNSDYGTTWFSEGFTEFFCRFLSMKSFAFARECNHFIVKYMSNPYRNYPNTIMTKNNFWKNKFIEKLPYTKGFMYALYLYQKYNGIFIKRYIKLIQDIKIKNIYTDNKTINKYLSDTKFHDFIIKGATIEIKSKKTFKMKCPKIEFDLDYAIENHKIKNLKNDDHAFHLGLRNGIIEKIIINYNKNEIIIEQGVNKIKINTLIGSYQKFNVLQ